jgi:signal peptidase
MKKQIAGDRRSKVATKVFGWMAVLAIVAAPSILQNYLGYGFSPVLTGSMSPYAEPGDAFITEKTLVTELKVGDIVTLFSKERGELFAHRIVETRDANGLIRITTKGDANSLIDSDPYIASPNEIVAKTIGNVPKLGSVIVYATSFQGRQAGIALIVFANVIALMLFLFRKKDEKEITNSELIYKDLFSQSSQSAAHERTKATTYRNLYQEAQHELQLLKGEK